MTLYDIINWNTGNTTAKCLFAATLHNAVMAAKEKDLDSMNYYISQFTAMRDMYNAMETAYNWGKENRMSLDEEWKINRLIRKVYRRAD